MSLLPSRPDASPPEDAGPRVIGVDSEDADDVLAALSSGTARELLSELHDDPAPPSELADNVDTSVQNVKYHLDKLENAGAIEVVETAYSEKGREMDIYAPSDQPLVIFAGDGGKESTLKTALSRLLGGVGILAVASLAVQGVFGDGSLFSLGAGESAQEAPTSYDGDGAGDAQSGGADGDSTDGDLTTESEDPETDGGGDTGGDIGTETVDEPVDDGAVDDGADGTTDGGTTDGGTVDDGTDGGTVDDGADGGTDAADAPTEDAADAEPVSETVNVTDGAEEMAEPEAADAVLEGAAALPPGLLFFAGGLFAIVLVVGYLYYSGRLGQ